MYRPHRWRIVLVLFFVFITKFAKTQDLDSLLNLSAYTEESELQKNLNKGLTVSSSKALSTREAPGIISVITAEEIQNAGARDLIDVLRMVPGFDVLQDVQEVLGIGLRGNWSNEGKVLVMLDGQPLNDLLYQTVAIGNRFPIDAIEKIEIIRGPGSAIYGGSAEYGVINIKTKAAESLNGVAAYGTGGFHASAVGRTNGGVMIAGKSEKISWDAAVFKGQGIISDRSYLNEFQDTAAVNLAKATKADPMNINVGLKSGGFQLRTMYDEFKTQDPTTFSSFKSFFVDTKYDFKINDRLTVTPQVRYFNEIPWQYGYGSLKSGESTLKARAQRYYGSLSASYDISRKVNINAGLIYFEDWAKDLLDGNYFQGNNTISFRNVAVFAQGLIKHRLVNATLGFRYERNNHYGSAFVPRIALTKKIENIHFKLLYSQAFRAPAIENINLALNGRKIKPEKSSVFEIEVGYQFTSEMLLSINAYNILTKRIIVYGSEDEGSYKNYPKSGSRGLELVYSIRKKKWYAGLTYSFSRALSGDSVVQTYVVPQTAKQYVGFPAHKFTLNTNFNLISRLTFNPTFVVGGSRYAYTGFKSIGQDVQVINSNKLNPYFLVNAFLNYKNLLPGLTAGFGVYDILNQRPAIPQAYKAPSIDGAYSPIPGRSREYVVKVYYQLNFKK